MQNFTLRDVVIISILDKDPPCVGVGDYAKYHLSYESNGKQLLVKRFVIGLSLLICVLEACIIIKTAQEGLNLFLSFYSG